MPTRDFLLDRMEHFLRTRLSEEAFSNDLPFRPALTISRECGAGMDIIGCSLVDYLSETDHSTDLGWALFNQRIIGKIIESHDLPKSVVPFVAENTKFHVTDLLGELLNRHPSEWTLFNYFADTIRNLCRMGNAIVVGRAGNLLTADMNNTFHVRLIGSLAKRIQHTASRHEISIESARDVVRETDKSRKSFVQRYTESDIEDPEWYHLVLSTDDFLPETVTRIIGDSLLEWALQKEKQLKEVSNGNIS